MRASHLVKYLVVTMLLCPAALAQSSASKTEHFTKDGLSFNYPAEWKLEDQSTSQEQRLVLTHAGSSALIMIVALRTAVTSRESLIALRDAGTTPFVQNLAQKLGVEPPPLWENATCAEVGSYTAVGFLLHGAFNQQPSTGEVYALVIGQRFVNLVYVRVDKDDAEGGLAWKEIGDTLKVEGAAAATASELKPVDLVAGGKAIRLGLPHFPKEARGRGLSGTVLVQIMIDEEGKVVSARAIKGPTVMRNVSEQAALQSRFTPTILCGRPVKTPGVLTFNFVAQ